MKDRDGTLIGRDVSKKVKIDMVVVGTLSRVVVSMNKFVIRSGKFDSIPSQGYCL